MHVGEPVGFELSAAPERLWSPGVVAVADQASWSSSLATGTVRSWDVGGGGGRGSWPSDGASSWTDSMVIVPLPDGLRGLEISI